MKKTAIIRKSKVGINAIPANVLCLWKCHMEEQTFFLSIRILLPDEFIVKVRSHNVYSCGDANVCVKGFTPRKKRMWMWMWKPKRSQIKPEGIPVGCIPSTVVAAEEGHVCPGGVCPEGVCLGVSARGGVCPGGVYPRMHWTGGVSPGVCVSQHALGGGGCLPLIGDDNASDQRKNSNIKENVCFCFRLHLVWMDL